MKSNFYGHDPFDSVFLSFSHPGQTQPALKTCTPSPAQPVQAGAFAPRTPLMTQKVQMPIQSPTPLQAKATVNQMAVQQQQVRPQVQLHQGTQVIAVPGIQLQPEQTVKLHLPVQIQQQAGVACHTGVKTQQVQNVVTLQTASVQEQLQRIQQLREQQQQKKRQQQEAKKEQQQQAMSQCDLIQKQVSRPHCTTGPGQHKHTAHVRNRRLCGVAWP